MTVEKASESNRAIQGRTADTCALSQSEITRLFSPYQNAPVRILKMGVSSESPLDQWSQYFAKPEKIVGCNLAQSAAELTFKNPCIELVEGDVNQPVTWEQILNHSDSYTIMIDEGARQSSQVIQTFLQYFPLIENNGVYAIQGLQCSYWDEFGGGLYHPFSPIAFFKRLVDILNHDHWGVKKSRTEFLKAFGSEFNIELDEATLDSISRIEFTNSMCVIKKSAVETSLSGLRLFSGEVGDLAENAATPDQSENLWSDDASALEDQLRLSNQLVTELQQALARQSETAQNLQQEITRYHSSLSWKVTRPLRVSRRVLGKTYHRARRVALKPRETLRSYIDSRKTRHDYESWTKAHELSKGSLKKQRKICSTFEYQPLISIILPVYKIDKKIFEETINSVLAQSYTNWEICIAFAYAEDQELLEYLQELAAKDKRFKVEVCENKGISANSNVSLALAEGDFISLLDHDDILAPFALYEVVRKLNESSDVDFLYSDKDCINESGEQRLNALFKPNWSPEIMYSVNYLTHFNIIRRSVVEDIGGFRSETDGAQDWDLFLRVSQVTEKIERITGVFYHWRIHIGSTASGIEAKPYAIAGQLKTVEDHVAFKGFDARVELNDDSGFRILWNGTSQTTVDMLIDVEHSSSERLNTLIESIYANSGDYEVRIFCLVKSNFDWKPSSQVQKKLSQIKTREYDSPEQKTAIMHQLVQQGDGDCLVFTTDSVQELNEQCLTELVGWTTQNPEIAFTSSLVLDPTETVVEAGLIVDKHGNGTPLFRDSILRQWGWFGGPLWYRNCSASNPWMVSVARSEYQGIGGLDDELEYRKAFINLCGKIRSTGKRGFVNPHARVKLVQKPKNDIPAFDESLTEDPYFHPYFSSAYPLELKH